MSCKDKQMLCKLDIVTWSLEKTAVSAKQVKPPQQLPNNNNKKKQPNKKPTQTPNENKTQNQESQERFE